MTAAVASRALRRTAPRRNDRACPAGAPWSGPLPPQAPRPGETPQSASRRARPCGIPCRDRRCTAEARARASTGPEPGRCGSAGPARRPPGRVVGAEVERVEVEPFGLDLGTLGDLPAHGHEDVADALGDELERDARL